MTIKIDKRPWSERVRTIDFSDVVTATVKCCIEANSLLPPDVLEAIEAAAQRESSELGRDFLTQYVENAKIAAAKLRPICQDTGFAVFFVEMGEMLRIEGGSICEALTQGTSKGYESGFLRKSIVKDPVFRRENTRDNTPPVIHLKQVPGDKLKVLLAPKGGGSENMSALKMLKPSDGEAGLIDFVVETICRASGNPCPPVIVGVGVGGTAEKAMFLAKKALLRPVGSVHPEVQYAQLEAKIKEKLNASGIGPQGLGGDTTVLAVHLEEFPCHIASLPVAVALNCHAARHAEFEL